MRANTLRMFLSLLIAGVFVTLGSAQDVAGPEGTTLYVKVTQNREISGASVDLAEVNVTTSFGQVAIPVAKIDGIKMHVDASDSAVIAFKNGDLVTGKVDLSVIKLKTDWGTAHVNTSQIDTVTTNRNARFYPDTSGGTKGWRFTNAATVSAPGGPRVISGGR